MKKIIILLVVALAFSGCAKTRLARHGTVIPKPDGFFVASGYHKQPDIAMKVALASAELTCEDKDKTFVVYETNSGQNEALVNEKVAQTADLISTAASIAGNWIPNGNMLRSTKEVHLLFKCE